MLQNLINSSANLHSANIHCCCIGAISSDINTSTFSFKTTLISPYSFNSYDNMKKIDKVQKLEEIYVIHICKCLATVKFLKQIKEDIISRHLWLHWKNYWTNSWYHCLHSKERTQRSFLYFPSIWFWSLDLINHTSTEKTIRNVKCAPRKCYDLTQK